LFSVPDGAGFHPKNDLKAIPLGLYQYFGDFQVDWGAVMAASLVATVQTLLLILPLQEKLVAGLTQGATGEQRLPGSSSRTF